MTSQTDFDQFVESQRGVRRLLLRDLAAWFATVEQLAPSEIRKEARAFLPLLAGTYGEVSAAAAADFYDASRGDSGASGRFTATLADSRAASSTAGLVRWATDPLFTGNPADALARLGGIADAAALQDGKNTVMHNAKRDPAKPRFARVPSGKTCAWCLMLASRGAVYRSAETAGSAAKFHGNCDCQPTPSWDHGNDLPESYDEGHLFGLYDRARGDAGSGDPKKITAALRRLDGGIHVNDGVPLPL